MAQRRQGFAQPRQFALEGVEIVARPGDEGDALGMRRDIGQRQLALALVGAHLAQAEQPRQPAIAVAVDRVGEQARRVLKVEPAADQRPQPGALGGAVHPDHAGQRVAVGDADRVHAESSAGSTSSIASEAPRRKEKGVVTPSST